MHVLFAFALLASTAPTAPAAPETHTAPGMILSKTFQPTSVYRQYPAGQHAGFWQPSDIPIAESYVFEIKLDGMSDQVRYSLNTVAAKAFQVGQRVTVIYVKRAIVPLRRRIYVRDMQHLE